MPHMRFCEARQPLEVIRHKIRRMLKVRLVRAFSEQQQARYKGLLIAEARCLRSLRV
jgi:hypothetical protein